MTAAAGALLLGARRLPGDRMRSPLVDVAASAADSEEAAEDLCCLLGSPRELLLEVLLLLLVSESVCAAAESPPGGNVRLGSGACSTRTLRASSIATSEGIGEWSEFCCANAGVRPLSGNGRPPRVLGASGFTIGGGRAI